MNQEISDIKKLISKGYPEAAAKKKYLIYLWKQNFILLIMVILLKN